MKKKDSVKRVSPWELKYNFLAADVKRFVTSIRNLKTTTTFMYKDSEAPAPVTPGGPPQQFNALEVRHLITQVLTAQGLGYQTILTTNAAGNTLIVSFAEKQPNIPASLYLP
jgi:hypothetical protein